MKRFDFPSKERPYPTVRIDDRTKRRIGGLT